MTHLNSPRNVRYVLHDNFDNYVKAPNFKDILSDAIGTGIFTTDGAAWKMHRKIGSHMFSQRILKEGAKIAVRESQSMIKKLWTLSQRRGGVQEESASLLSSRPEEQSTKTPSVGKTQKSALHCATVDIQDLFFRFTLDVFAHIAFGISLHSIERDTPHPFGTAFDEVQSYAVRRFDSPMWRLRRRFWWASRSERKYRKELKTMNDFLLQAVQAKRRDAKSSKLGPDLISQYLERGSQFGHDEKFTDEELCNISAHFFLAGRDTTATALTWTMFELIKNPEVARKIRAEADSVFGFGKNSEGKGASWVLDPIDTDKVTYKRVSKDMPYTHAVVTEVLRLHPSIPTDLKYAKTDDVLPDGTRIPADGLVIYSPYGLGRNPELYNEPLAFRPERWLVSNRTAESCREPSMYDTAVFNAMPRLCLGKPLAYLEIKLMTALLVQRFDFSCPTEPSGAYRQSLVLRMDSLHVSAKPRCLHASDTSTLT